MESAPILTPIVAEHAEEAGFLWLQRASAVHAPNYSPVQFADLDERLEAHIDGLRVAGDGGRRIAGELAEGGEPEHVFASAVLAIEATDDTFADLLARSEEVPEATPGLISALGWVEPTFLSGRVKSLLDAESPFQQMLGVAACAMHRRDPGAVLQSYVTSPAATVRSRALRSAGELGRRDLLPPVLAAVGDAKRDVQFWAAWAGVLLGNRGRALDGLVALASSPGPRRLESLRLALQAMDIGGCHELLLALAESPDAERLRVIGGGLSGSIRYVPWLVDRMHDPVLARIAGEAFVNITGADFNLDQLEALPPEGFDEGPTDDPADENVEVPEDAALPWPDVTRIKAWWAKHASRFAADTRYFLGLPLGADSCRAVLETGFQSQRVRAARFLSLIEPGTPLFNTSAPAWRQQPRQG